MCPQKVRVISPIINILVGHQLFSRNVPYKVNIIKPNTALRKHAYSNILKILPPKTEIFQIKILIFFHISDQNIDCGYSLEPPRRGGSNEYPQSMFLSVEAVLTSTHNLCF